jgi:uncharacterized alkaline shock family protein YloU
MGTRMGTVIISPAVLSMIARMTALSVPGVAHMACRGVNRFLGSRSGDGVKVQVIDDRVIVDLYVVAESEVNMLNLSREIQSKVTRSIQDIVGMAVREVNVHVADVVESRTAQT